MARLIGCLRNFWRYFRERDGENQWDHNHLFSILRPFVALTGLLTYGDVFSGTVSSNLKEFMIFGPLVLGVFLQWIIAVKTTLDETKNDIYARIMVLPIVFAGATLVAQVNMKTA